MPTNNKSEVNSFREINGAINSNDNNPKSSIKEKEAASEDTNTAPKTKHTTHGGYTPIVGPITNARQLIGGKNIGKGSVGSFETLASYNRYLKSLTNAQLHRHAIDEARIVAIDDRERLIKRLEAEWTGVTAREAAGSSGKQIPKRPGFTAKQLAVQAELKEKLLKGR